MLLVLFYRIFEPSITVRALMRRYFLLSYKINLQIQLKLINEVIFQWQTRVNMIYTRRRGGIFDVCTGQFATSAVVACDKIKVRTV